jgi:hypothetical protein
MSARRSIRPAGPPRAPAALGLLLGALVLLATTGCVSIGGGGRPPAHTTVETRTTVLPAQVVANFFLVEARQADGRTYRFMIDTGSSATLVSPALARSLRLKEKRQPARTVRVRGAQGGEVELESVTLRSLSLGDASFEQVPALIYDCTELSSHLGLALDGVIGFPLFRNTLLTLDYPGSRLVLAPPSAAGIPAQSPRVSTIAFNNEQNSPLIPIQMGNESFIVLIDSGSDGGLSLNPVGLHPRFAHGPRVGLLVASLSGDHRQLVGRLAQDVVVGSHRVEQPVTDLTDQLSSLGGEFLRHFALTFDQRNSRVTFTRSTDEPVRMEARRNTGLSFSRTAAYWRVLAVVPETPAAQAPVQAGDLCVRINGEPVEKWGAERYATLLHSAAKVTYTFLNGPKETDLELPVFDLVP